MQFQSDAYLDLAENNMTENAINDYVIDFDRDVPSSELKVSKVPMEDIRQREYEMEEARIRKAKVICIKSIEQV